MRFKEVHEVSRLIKEGNQRGVLTEARPAPGRFPFTVLHRHMLRKATQPDWSRRGTKRTKTSSATITEPQFRLIVSRQAHKYRTILQADNCIMHLCQEGCMQVVGACFITNESSKLNSNRFRYLQYSRRLSLWYRPR